MLTKGKLLFAALAATAMMLTLVANASARNFSVSEREFEVFFNPLTFNAAGNNISCPITLLANYVERTIPKTNTQVARIRNVSPSTGAEPSPCTGGTITVLNETLPWSVNYVSFTGTLPTIRSVRVSLIGTSFRVTPRGSATCLVGTTVRNPA